MRSFIGILLITVLMGNSIVPSLGLQQSIKIPEIVKHFNEHNLDEKVKISFWEFLKLHYSADSKHFNSNKPEHNTLPNLDLSAIALFLVEGFFILEFSLLVIPIIRKRNSQNKNLYEFSYINLLYGPPKYY